MENFLSQQREMHPTFFFSSPSFPWLQSGPGSSPQDPLSEWPPVESGATMWLIHENLHCLCCGVSQETLPACHTKVVFLSQHCDLLSVSAADASDVWREGDAAPLLILASPQGSSEGWVFFCPLSFSRK